MHWQRNPLAWCGALATGLALTLAAHGAEPAPFNWGGDVRIRLDLKSTSHTVPSFDKQVKLRARIGADGALADGKVLWGVKLATVPTGRNPLVSRNLTLAGGNLNGGNAVGIDLAYVTLVPSKRLSVTLGKFVNPFWETDGIFDPDLTLDGVLLSAKLHEGAKDAVVRGVTNSLSWVPLSESKAVTADAFLVADQLRGRLGPVDTALAAYFYSGLKNAGTYTDGGKTLNYTGQYTKDKATVLSLRASSDLPGKRFPIALTGEVFNNVAVKAKALGLEGRIDFKKVGPGAVWIAYRTVGINATYDGWVDSEFGEHTGYKSGLRVEYSQPVWKTALFRTAFYRFDPVKGGVDKRTNRLLFDVSSRF